MEFLVLIPTSDKALPCRLYPRVVAEVGPERFDDIWVYAVEPLKLDRPKMKFQTKRDTEVYAVRGWSMFASGTRLFIRLSCASEPVTA